MIQLQVDTKQLMQEVQNRLEGVKALTSTSVLEDLGKATFAITGERFMIAADNYARRNPKKMHHVYEWGQVGNSRARLFVLERSSVLAGDLMITAKFLPSKMPVPINPELLSPGRTGKVVSRRSVFKDKARVMEEGKMVSFTAKRVLSFMGTNGIAFIAPGKTINIMHPGGVQTRGAFESFMYDWYVRNGSSAMDSSGVYERIANDVSLILSTNGSKVSQIKTAVTKIANDISGGMDVIS